MLILAMKHAELSGRSSCRLYSENGSVNENFYVSQNDRRKSIGFSRGHFVRNSSA